MIYKRLKIHNIASIADAEIDFEHGPVALDTLLLICGETGAGKTTILDAICLALFATTCRMKAAKREDYNDKLKTNDVRQVLRKGEKECFAELFFEGVNGLLYTARFECKQARTGNLGSVKHSLRSQCGTVDLEGISKTLPEIERNAVGSDIDNFCRTNMLAQGEFSRFLDGSEDEKAVVLEQLTGTEIYAALGKRIYDTWNEKNKQLELASQQIAAKREELLGEEAREGLARQLEGNRQQIMAVEADKAVALGKAQWLKDVQSVQLQKQETERMLAAEQARQATEQYRGEEQLIADFGTAQGDDALADMAACLSHQKALAALKAEEETWRNSALHVANVLKAHRAELERKNNSLALLASQLESMPAAQKKLAENADLVLLDIDNLQRETSEEKKCRLDIELFASKRTEICDAIAIRKNALKEAGDKADAAAKALGGAEDILRALQPEQINQRVNALQKLVGEMEKAELLLATLNQTVDKRNTAERDFLEHNAKMPVMQSELEKAQQLFENAGYVLNHVKLSTNDYARHLRHEVKPGDVCPVCGRTIEQEISEDFFMQLLEGPQREYDKAVDALNSAKAAVEAGKQLQERLQSQLADADRAMEKAKQDFAGKTALLSRELQNAALPGFDWTDAAAACASKCGLQQELLQLQGKQEEVVRLTNELTERQKELNRRNAALAAAKDALLMREKELAQCDEKTASLNLMANTASANAEKARAHISELLGSDLWRAEYDAGAEAYAANARRLADGYKEDVEKCRKLQNDAELQKLNDENAELKFNALKGKLTSWNLAPTADVETVANVVAFVDSACAGVDQWLGCCQAEQRALHEVERRIAGFVAAHPGFSTAYLQQLLERKDDIRQFAAAHTATNSAVSEAAAKLGVFASQLQQKMAQTPPFAEGERELEACHFESLAGELGERLKELTEENGRCQTMLQADDALRKSIEGRLRAVEQLKGDMAPWEELKRVFGDATGKTFKKIAQNYILSALLVAANRHLRQYAPRFTLVAHPGQLTILALDAENMNEALSSASLSGGQKFMVSLALALGLAEMCGGVKAGANILFIDEGFGSLDDAHLDGVMLCLEKLHQQSQRKVAIISHVERLRAQIPTHIEVERLPGTAAASRVNIVCMERQLA